MGLVVAGAILLVLGAVAFFVWRSQHGSLNAMLLTETLTCAELGELSRAASDAVGPGSFSQVCEVVGAAAAGDQGVLTAPESGREVVWHRSQAIEHYWDTERDMSKVEIGTGLMANIAEAFLQKDTTIGIESKEWGIVPGQRLYVLAEASDRGGRLAMMKPAEGKFVISTRTEDELRASKRGFVNVARVLAIVLAAIGVVLIVLGLVL